MLVFSHTSPLHQRLKLRETRESYNNQLANSAHGVGGISIVSGCGIKIFLETGTVNFPGKDSGTRSERDRSSNNIEGNISGDDSSDSTEVLPLTLTPQPPSRLKLERPDFADKAPKR